MSYARVTTVPPHLFILILFTQSTLSWNEPLFDCNQKKAKQTILLVMLNAAPSHTC